MKASVIALTALALGADLVADDAQAKGRIGSGRSVGIRRQARRPAKPRCRSMKLGIC